MTDRNHVPADVDADSIIDLVEDCREISGVLGGAPQSARATATLGAMPVEIRPEAVRTLVGYGDYGS